MRGPIGAKPGRVICDVVARLATMFVVCVGVAALGPVVPADAQAPAVGVDPAPGVVPALREWSPSPGAFRLGAASRIVVDASSLAGDADRLRDDLVAVTGLSLPVVVKKGPRAGDLFLSAGGTDAQLGSEGYRLVIGDRVEITAAGATGVFYGTQTVLQMLRSMPGQRTLPRGEARDWPRFRERGYMLDVGRKYWSPDYIVQTIREMAYLKLNRLQLHFSDNNAFRLVSDRFPYLTAPEAYTKSDIRRFEAAARNYHVTIIPEIEMPAHAGAILAVRPDFGLDCLGFGTTLDVTRREVRDFTKGLIDEFAPLFSGPEFHIATDEYPRRFHQGICEPLVRYADERGFGSTADVFVDFINEMNTVVRSHGKRMVIWNWWDVDQDPTIAPDKTIKVEAWTTAATGPGEENSLQHYLGLGYDVVASPSDILYVTPGLRLLPNPEFLYEEWEPVEHPRLDGYLISVWADDAITQPDSSFDTHLRRPREAMAERVWGGPRRGLVADLFARADAIGTPPRVPENALPGTLIGTPYGTSPAWGDLPNTYDKVFDGDPSTFFDYAEPSGGYTGIDLGAGHASPVATIRFVPRNGQLGRMVGGRFEGCTDGPTSGCRTLATVKGGPVLGWNELAVADTGRYRWLRYVGPDGSSCDVAEIEFVAPARDVTVKAPAQLRQLDDNRVVTSYRNTSTRPVFDVRLDLSAYATDDRAARAVRPSGQAGFPVVAPGKTVSTSWQVDVPLSAATGTYHLVGRASYQLQQGEGQPLQHASGFSRTALSRALDAVFEREFVDLDVGESEDTKLRIANHAARAVTVGWAYNRPPTANAGFALAPAEGTLTIPAGGTASATLTASAADDASGASPSPARVDLTAASEGGAGGTHFRAGSVEFKVLWYPGAAPSVGATYNSKGITDDNNPTAGSFDGGEASYSAQGLAAAGLGRGATITHDGLTFTWPDTAPGEPDNTATDGQVIAASGSGTKLGFLGAACCSPTGGQSGTAFITYDDGSIVQAPLAFADWYFNDPLPGTDIVATVPWNVPPGHPDPDHPVSVFYGAIPLDSTKTVRFVTLPTNPNLHIFAMAIGGS